MRLHNEIMNIQSDHLKYGFGSIANKAYKIGHRDARHKAAELSLEAEQRIEELESSLECTLGALERVLSWNPVRNADEIIFNARKVLKDKEPNNVQ